MRVKKREPHSKRPPVSTHTQIAQLQHARYVYTVEKGVNSIKRLINMVGSSTLGGGGGGGVN